MARRGSRSRCCRSVRGARGSGIPRADAIATLGAAREAGIDLLDTARYHDAAGNSEIVFGEILRASGWPRDEVTIANKLWWEFWPEQSAAEELDASLQRTGLDHST